MRALRKTGYHNSFNANAAYYSLPQTPVFDDHGLWFHRRIGFSRHGNLLQTLAADPAQQRRQQAQRQTQTMAAPLSAVGAGPALPAGF